MTKRAVFAPAHARHAHGGLYQMSRQLLQLIGSIHAALGQLRLIPDPQFFLQVVTGLTTLQTAVSDLLRSYLKHTNSVLGSTPYRLDTYGISNPLNNNDLLAGALRETSPPTAPVAVAPAPAPVAATPAVEEPAKKGRKPKKEKKEKDPNEPKRPLTIYFLFAAEARPIVRGDLGEGATPGQIEEEVQKRWKELGDAEKTAWKEIYNKNREVYVKDMEKYKATKGQAAVAGATETPDVDGDVNMAEAATAAGAEVNEATTASEEESEEASPPKAPTPPVEKTPKNKRRKTGKENGATNAAAASSAAAPTNAASPIPLPTQAKAAEATPVKSKRGKKDEPKAKEVAKETPVEEPKKRRGRKSKGAEEAAASAEPVVEEAPAPAAEKKNKRKRKSEAAS